MVLQIIIAVFSTFAGIFIGHWYNDWKKERSVKKCLLTGTWISSIYIGRSNTDMKRAIDFVNCKHDKKTNSVSGNIVRILPEPKDNEEEKEWEFLGRFSNSNIYIVYWGIKGNASSGVILMNYNEEEKTLLGEYKKFQSKITRIIAKSVREPVDTAIGWEKSGKTLDEEKKRFRNSEPLGLKSP